jgi:replicative DNA helicase
MTTYDDLDHDTDASLPVRMPPQDVRAEEVTLGAMMLSQDAIAAVLEIVRAGDYYRPVHETIHGAIIDLFARGEPADPITVTAELQRRGQLDRVGGPVYVHGLASAVPSAVNADWYAQIVADTAILRRLATAGERIAHLAYAGEGDAREVVDRAQMEVFAVAHEQTEEDVKPLAVTMPATLERIEQRGEKPGALIGIPTGFADLDSLTGGLRGGQMIVVAGRPGHGKSTLGVDFARAASIKHGLTSVVFSLEMGEDEINERILSAEARVGLHHLRTGNMTDDDWARIARVQPKVDAAPLYVDASANLSALEIRTKARRLAQRHGLSLIVVDYLQLMQSGKGRAENRQLEVSDISRSLKLLGKELDVPVVALSQLNRGPEQRQDKMPTMADLRESGAIENDADMVILIHRPDAYEKSHPRAGEADLIVAKHRGGPTATITVAFQGHYSSFKDMAADVEG